jgi:hypothetical protein
MERNKGKLIPVNINTENYTSEDFDTLAENNMYVIGGKVYKVEWEVEGETDYIDFADVKVNSDGSIDFHTLHYNGGAFWTEVIEEKL